MKNEKYSALGKPKIHMQFVLSSTWPCVEVEMVKKKLEKSNEFLILY